jgi:hypothetical protein
MKTTQLLACAVSLLVFSIGSAHAEEPDILGTARASSTVETVFIGGMTVTAVTPQCQNFKAGWYSHALYHPYLAGNRPWSGLNLIWDWGASGYSLSSKAFTSTFQNVYASGVGWGGYGWSGAKVRIVSQVPQVITTATPFLSMTFQIAFPEADNGGAACIATIDAGLVKNPNP